MDWTVSLKKTYVPYIPSISQKNQLKRTQTLQEQPSQRMPKALFPFLQHFLLKKLRPAIWMRMMVTPLALRALSDQY